MKQPQYNLVNKIAIITGASRGIGKTIAKQLASLGVKIQLVARNEENLANINNIINNMGYESDYSICDTSDLYSFQEIVDITVQKWGSIDILINNAGITRDNLILRMSEKDWDTVINTNLKGYFNGIKAVSKTMLKNRYGRIINISSVIGQIGNAGQSNYAASKAGIIALTKSIAKELGSKNITINSIAPGYIQTDMTEQLNEQTKNILIKSIPLKRLGHSEDVANIVCFLASDLANYITGQTFNVDGGMVMI